MPSKDGLTASLVCNGTVSTEYPSSPNTPLTVYCESKPGDTFVVKMTGKQPKHDISARLFVDGVRVCKVQCRTDRGEHLNISFRGIRSSTDPSKLRPFQFTNIKLSDEDVGGQDEQIIKNLGTVNLKLYKCVYGQKNTKLCLPGKSPRLAADQKFSEQNKKASMIPHTVGLGAPVSTSHKRSSYTYPRLSKEEDPYLEFTWHYRSRNVLIAKEIMPRPIIESVTLYNSTAMPAGNDRENPFVIDDDDDKEEPKPFLPVNNLKRGARASEPPVNQSSSSEHVIYDQSLDEKPDTKSSGGVPASKRLKTSEV